ncbi:hypothetical protein WA171_000759 [Blastocystis sp. BT1]
MNELKELKTRAKPQGLTRKYMNSCKRHIYYIDLMDFSSKQERWIQDNLIKNGANFNKNHGYKYVLVCIDGYSRYLMTRLLKTKTGKEVTAKMNDIIKTYGAPDCINCDRGTEFVNDIFRTQILNKYNIKMYHMVSENKSVFAERVIRTIKESIMVPFNRSNGIWADYIDNAVKKHNEHKNNDTGYTPNQIWKENYVYMEDAEPDSDRMSMKDRTPQFGIGEYVRVVSKPSVLQKKSLTFKWSRTLYEVVGIDDSVKPIMYEVKNSENDSVCRRKYYHWELLKSKCIPETKSIIQTRKQSERTPESRKVVAKTHKPVTRSQTKPKGLPVKHNQTARKRRK